MQLTIYISQDDEKYLPAMKASAKKDDLKSGLGAYFVKLHKGNGAYIPPAQDEQIVQEAYELVIKGMDLTPNNLMKRFYIGYSRSLEILEKVELHKAKEAGK